MKIETRDTAGAVNGWILPLWNALELPTLRPDQVYVTAIAPHKRKGPHLHKERRGLFVCIRGEVMLRQKLKAGNYADIFMHANRPALHPIAPGLPCALYNLSDTEALVVNMPAPAWSKENPDDWPVEEWEDPAGWPQ